jgi:hypothetical protein
MDGSQALEASYICLRSETYISTFYISLPVSFSDSKAFWAGRSSGDLMMKAVHRGKCRTMGCIFPSVARIYSLNLLSRRFDTMAKS